MTSCRLGTPLQAIDSEGKLIWERELDIYGRIRKEKGEKGFCNFRYQGQYFDSEVDLCYNRYRYYDPSTGIYISQDPIGLAGGLNLYSYVHDSNFWVDIFGLYLHRPYIRVSTRMAVEKEANIINNRFVDANNPNKLIKGGKRRSYSIAEGKYHLGHKKGNEFWREKEKAEVEGLTQKQFNDRMNNPALYQIEDPYENMSHKHEKKKDKKLNSCNKK
ncbi:MULTISPECIES: RHS repeat-associated core domain-containing protein [unclassified Treponema]|uniref:RHS repeat-associated core domain-containing protein n=1 Tax=unclassified Treponema TaxID=2638727 RepID=UPI002200FC9B|nr:MULTISPECIES: RHS repeat-associated core domain-containing protein [unclassified Treponema]UTC66586.1 hypothetical protein E4O06_11595 [Treponema sp. OMZ 789]UTC69319.1 hypothetical protein E4O01_11735 [Treponema sp. OMZ 790]UTC72033.1 hypothetical protein E4O02_11830 [Treponema sp. OMZ 791]